MVDVKITYETLFDLLRREKGRNELQGLESTFYTDVITYLKDKQKILHGQDSKSPLYSRGEQEKIRIQIKNIKKILRELYELREKKILNLAVNKVKTGSDLVDTSNLLAEERSFFADACTLLDKYKQGVLEQTLMMESSSIDLKNYSEPIRASRSSDEDEEENTTENSPSNEFKPATELNSETSQSESVKIKVLCDLPKFVGTDKNIYGPFNKNDEAEVPSNIAMLLVKKGRASSI
ncbi:hypothetical protein COV13_04370 [Candidatus Woesearchaeota archaeon CG10_big_fil_rev_8_21_14_0_10_32_9]|nr:MAG: hypothetical protein COV13_04370 [Candidatus Woesearchaeota archaeon CG10_big_fil_rev_8_21_14_0_10_32_9]